jgi:hypothetical protein
MNLQVDRIQISPRAARSFLKLFGCVPFALVLAACASADGQAPSDGAKRVVVAPEQQGLIRFETLEAKRVQGVFEYHGVTLGFDSETTDAGHFITFQLRGMTLTATVDDSGVFDLDGFESESGEDTQLTEADKTVIHTFEVALTEVYNESGSEFPALGMLTRLATLWGDYPVTMPLRRTFYGRNEQAVLVNLCHRLNTAHQGVQLRKYTWGSHDCSHVESLFGSDCGAWELGCSYGDDSSTTEMVFLSMHPRGNCNDGAYFATNLSNFTCFEPDHDASREQAYGDCFGRCGSSCGPETAFTQACLDHDQCVMGGHFQASPDCDDHFPDAGFDFLFATWCFNANFEVDFNWAGTSLESNCPSAFINTNDGCDVGCQVIDGDCFR